jgi:sodium-dependent dicarboxylate transporter 2/3/5
LLYLVALTAFLSFFIPNAITVLTLLPILELLRKAYAEVAPKQGIPTMLALSVIYGANIEGMGSVTATPANGILVTYAELNHVAGRDYLNFAPWLIWGIPLVFCFVMVAWLISAGLDTKNSHLSSSPLFFGE